MAKDLTQGMPAKRILGFALPLLLGNFVQQCHSMINTVIVGRAIGVDALAAVGSTVGITFFLIGFIQAMTSGFAIITAQSYGAKKSAAVRKSFCVNIILSFLASCFFTLVSTFFAREILLLLHTPAAILEAAHSYIIVIYAGITVSALGNCLFNTILALGDSRPPLLFLMAGCVLNILLDGLFILVFSWGIPGAAWATVISQIATALLCIMYIAKNLPALRLRKKDWRITGEDLWRSMRLGLPMGFQASIIALGAIVMQWALNGLGPKVVAAVTVGRILDLVAILPLASFGLAMATYVGQNFGRGDISRIRQGVWHCCAMSLCFSVVVGLVNIFAGPYIIRAFLGSGEDEVVSLGHIFLSVNSSMYWVLALLFIFRFSLQGLGKSLVPTFAGVMELIMRAVAAVALTKQFGFYGACAANPMAWVGSCVPLCLAYFFNMRALSRRKEGVGNVPRCNVSIGCSPCLKTVKLELRDNSKPK